MHDYRALARYAVFGVFVLSVLIALASWLVRARHVSPFGALGRVLRAASDPVIRPVEGRLVRAGGNPVNAGWWLVVVVAISGVVLLSLAQLRSATLRRAAQGPSDRAHIARRTPQSARGAR